MVLNYPPLVVTFTNIGLRKDDFFFFFFFFLYEVLFLYSLIRNIYTFFFPLKYPEELYTYETLLALGSDCLHL